MNPNKLPVAALWSLGATQILGYGTLYYSFPILAPDIARSLEWTESRVFGAFSIALLVSAFLAPMAGRCADRFGAVRIMTFGSAAAAVALLACSLAPEPMTFVAALIAMQFAGTFVLYGTAFVAVVQLSGAGARRGITHLTLIAGFASTLFWPLTSYLHGLLNWREIYMLFAALNLAACLPLHAGLARLASRRRTIPAASESREEIRSAPSEAERRTRPGIALFLLMLAGFSLEGFVLSSILVHMVPLVTALGLGTATLYVSAIFGPAQVASRLINMIFGERLSQAWLAVIAAGLLALGVAVLMMTTPNTYGAVLFVILFGMGSGLNSIIGGTLPLELFGRDGFGTRMGWVTGTRQVFSATAPFVLAVSMAGLGIMPSLAGEVAVAVLGIVTFGAVVYMRRRL